MKPKWMPLMGDQYGVWESMQIFRYKTVRRWIKFWAPKRVVLVVLERRVDNIMYGNLEYTMKSYRWREVGPHDMLRVTPRLLYPYDESEGWETIVFHHEMKMDAFNLVDYM